MKKQLLAVAALATVSGVAMAQATVYGNIDMALTNSSAAAAGGASSKTSMDMGGISPSVIGFKGSEDLGGGLKASFALEGHIDPTNGSNTALNGGGTLFGRQANVALSGSFGAVTVGRQFAQGLLHYAATDPRGIRESFSGLSTFFATAPQQTFNNHSGVFLSNAVSYSNSSGPLSAGVSYAMGELAGDMSKYSLTSIGATYTSPVVLSGSYELSNTVNGTRDTSRYSLGAGYKIGAFNAKANYLHSEQSAAGATYNVWGVGGDYAVAANGNLSVAYYSAKNTRNSAQATNSFVAGYEYAMSKRTTAYVQYAVVSQGNTATAVNIMNMATTAGTSASVGQLGIKHSF